MAPALREQNTGIRLCTIVVLNLSALKEDVASRLGKTPIKFAVYNSALRGVQLSKSANFPTVMLTQVEDIDSDFLKFLMINTDTIRRVVVDECHLFATAVSYRPQLSRLALIGCAGFPLLLLTATMPSSLWEASRAMLKLNGTETVLRCENSVRPNLKYTVVNCDRDLSAHLELEQELHDLLLAGYGKGIVFTQTRSAADELYHLLKAQFMGKLRVLLYHSSLEHAAKSESLESFRSQSALLPTLMIATNGFGVGIDIADVRLVLHYGVTVNLLDYQQMAGRAGREVARSRCGHPVHAA